MIRKIGIICQDANSRGFLMGVQARLECEAELFSPPANVGKSVYMTRRQARYAQASFRNKGVDLIVRFTDSDNHKWQDVRRKEPESFSEDARSILVCGVAVRNTEHWLNLMQPYIAEELDIPSSELNGCSDATDLIKNALKKKLRRPDQNASDVVAELVKNAPAPAFKLLLENKAFRQFYDDCRSKAAGDNCEVTNEL